MFRVWRFGGSGVLCLGSAGVNLGFKGLVSLVSRVWEVGIFGFRAAGLVG